MLLPFTPLSELSPTERATLLQQYSPKVLREIATPFVSFNGKHINSAEIFAAQGNKPQQLNG